MIDAFGPTANTPRRNPFLLGVFLITASVLLFQVLETRLLSVITWYYLAFFAISVAMLGMTAGAVWVYLRGGRFTPDRLSTLLADSALLTAVAMPFSMMVQFCLCTSLEPTLTSLFAWFVQITAMTLPYVFAGITVSAALTRSGFPVSQVYGVDLLGAAVGCASVVGIMNVLDAPSAILLAGLAAAGAAYAFSRGATLPERAVLGKRGYWAPPLPIAILLAGLVLFNMTIPFGFKPVMVKNALESGWRERFEKWNSYSRIVAYPPITAPPFLWGPAPRHVPTQAVPQAVMNIDGAAGTTMFHFDGTAESIDFLRYDLVHLAYHLPGIAKAAVIGVGGGPDVMAAHLFGVQDITGVELNPIFIELLTQHPFYARFSNLMAIPGIKFQVDDARSWFASTSESFDLIQMSMIDTWAATGAGAFSLSENGLYTLEGWRSFLSRLTAHGVFTVSRWYSPGDVNESGRMLALAMAAMMDRGAEHPRRHLFAAHADKIATLVLSRSPFTPDQLKLLRDETERLGFKILVDPDRAPASEVLQKIVAAKDLAGLNRASTGTFLDLSVPTDKRPFFFNQLRFGNILPAVQLMLRNQLGGGVAGGNLLATLTLLLIFAIALLAVVYTIVWPLRMAARSAPRLIVAGTIYFSLIGAGFMLAEISLMQFFGVFLGHPIYAMGVCLFSLILASGLGSLASGRFPLNSRRRLAWWGAAVAAYLLIAQGGLTHLFAATTGQTLGWRILISLAVIMPAGFLLGFGFPTGMALVQKVNPEPTPWFWGINGATGVLASVGAVMLSMSFGINVTMALGGACYLALIPTAYAILGQSAETGSAPLSAGGRGPASTV